MLFNSLHFLFFFPTVVAIYFALPGRFRWMLLLAASYYFYMCWKAEYAILIVVSTLIDYFAVLGMARQTEQRKKRKFLALSLASNLGILFAFKYFNFFSDSVRGVLGQFNVFYDTPAFHVLLPVGISFYTFQTLSYTIDVYRGRLEPERHLGIFAVYVAFFPQLVAGPIERATHLLPQFRKTFRFDYERAASGLHLILWGLFKKVAIADRLSFYVDRIYNDPTAWTGLPVIVATYFFAIQIYCDFSGYSDIAVGTARIMGFDLMRNFERPYLATDVGTFWRRWHVSLSTWFRDYVYLPLGGNRVSKGRWYANLLIVFLVSGLWHGARWTFVIWGALHGAYLVAAVVTKSARAKLRRSVGLERVPRLARWLQVAITFHLVLFAWVFFRANTVSDAFVILSQATMNLGQHVQWVLALDRGALADLLLHAVGIGWMDFAVLVGLVGLLVAAELVEELGPPRLAPRYAQFARLAWNDALLVLFLLFGAFDQQAFIYFQF